MGKNLAFIRLKNGKSFPGYLFQECSSPIYGEAVFTTGMTGYCESLTDPSYTGQILVFTYPLMGNYGISPPEKWESSTLRPSGVVVSESCMHWSHYEGTKSLLQWLESENIPLVTEVDTRALTKELRKHGSSPCAITHAKDSPLDFIDPNHLHLVSKVSIREPQEIQGEGKHVILVDCGMKSSILKHLQSHNLKITRVPYSYDYSNDSFDGVVLSNGPGDPQKCPETVSILKKILKKKKPVFGICLGSQILALAAGAKTYKLPFGHRGHNQPCIETKTGRCFITSQNHGYAVDESSLPKDWEVSYRNLNDQSVAGLSHQKFPYFAVQFHPEAAPGPTDTAWMFQKFINQL